MIPEGPPNKMVPLTEDHGGGGGGGAVSPIELMYIWTKFKNAQKVRVA